MKFKIIEGKIRGVRFFYREGTSDIKAFEEVIGKNVYELKGNKIQKGEFWYDCGGNVGAFALNAISKGADVEIFEPDPFNCEMIEKNLKLNGFTAKIHQVALVHDNRKEAVFYISKLNNFWRNSLFKDWRGPKIKVACVNFDEVTKDGVCVKMDIEGSEMPILENTQRKFKKLIFEWSFDIDDNLNRYWCILERLQKNYDIRCNEFKNKGVTIWPKNWSPKCENVFCYEKNRTEKS